MNRPTPDGSPKQEAVQCCVVAIGTESWTVVGSGTRRRRRPDRARQGFPNRILTCPKDPVYPSVNPLLQVSGRSGNRLMGSRGIPSPKCGSAGRISTGEGSGGWGQLEGESRAKPNRALAPWLAGGDRRAAFVGGVEVRNRRCASRERSLSHSSDTASARTGVSGTDSYPTGADYMLPGFGRLSL